MNTTICMLPGVWISNFQAGYAPHIIAHRDFVNLSLLEIRITQFRELSEIPATFWQSRWAPGISSSWAGGRGAGTHILALREKLEGPAQGRRCKLRVSLCQCVWQDPKLMEELWSSGQLQAVTADTGRRLGFGKTHGVVLGNQLPVCLFQRLTPQLPGKRWGVSTTVLPPCSSPPGLSLVLTSCSELRANCSWTQRHCCLHGMENIYCSGSCPRSSPEQSRLPQMPALKVWGWRSSSHNSSSVCKGKAWVTSGSSHSL